MTHFIHWFAYKIAAAMLILACISAAIVLYVYGSAQKSIYTDAADVPRADVAIVLGASVVRGELSPILEERTRGAIELYQAEKVSNILVTGDNQKADYDEITPVVEYLQAAGIPSEVIVSDRYGLDTYSSVHRARNDFGVSSAIIVTQQFHLPRSLFLARSAGVDATGYAVSGGQQAQYYVREVPAILKSVFDVASSRVPQEFAEL